MRQQLFMGVGAMVLGGLMATFALQEVSQMVVAQATGEATDHVVGVAAAQSVPQPAGEAMPGVEFSTEDAEALASWYAEEAGEESEPEFYEEEAPANQRSEYETREEEVPAEEGEPVE